ncbi:MAG: hypothetical protein U0556_17800 [Dehalococcoidia bacterium]
MDLNDTRSERQAAVDAFFAAVASGDAETAYGLMSSVFRLLFTLPAFRLHLEQDESLPGYLSHEPTEERIDAPPHDLALLELASFGDAVPDEAWQAEQVFDDYLQAMHVASRGVLRYGDGRTARFSAALVRESAGWRLKGYEVTPEG